MSRPTINDIVHYTSYGSKDGRYKSKCRAAIVTESHLNEDPATVGLAVINPTGIFFDRHVRQSDEKTGGTWHWPCVITSEEEEA